MFVHRAQALLVLGVLTTARCKASDAVTPQDVAVDPAATTHFVTDSAPRELAPTPPPRGLHALAALPLDRATAERPLAPAGATESHPNGVEPLAEWMRGTATPRFDSGDLEAIASAFDRMAQWSPGGPSYANWSSIALDGAAASRSGSLEGAKAACRACHAQYEARYKSELHQRPLS